MNILNKNRTAILQSLRWFKDNSRRADNGSFEWVFNLRLFIAQEILVRYTRADASIPERTYRRIVSLAVQSWLAKQETDDSDDEATLAAFLRAAEQERVQLEKASETYIVLMFLNVDESISQLEPISVLGDKLLVKRWEELAFLKKEDLLKEIQLRDRSNPLFVKLENEYKLRLWDFSPILLDVKTYGPEAAVSIASDRFDILRAILNISALSGHMTIFSEPKQLSLFLPTPVYGIFRSDGTFVSFYRTIEKFEISDYRSLTIKEEWLPETKSLLSLFSQELQPSRLAYHILNLMKIYQGATDLKSNAFAFLGMWQILESAVLFESDKDEHLDVISRVSTLIGVDPMLKESLNVFRDMRNKLVHNSDFIEEGGELLPILRMIAEACVDALLRLEKKISTTKELRDYLKFSPLGDVELERTKGVINFIQDTRKD